MIVKIYIGFPYEYDVGRQWSTYDIDVPDNLKGNREEIIKKVSIWMDDQFDGVEITFYGFMEDDIVESKH